MAKKEWVAGRAAGVSGWQMAQDKDGMRYAQFNVYELLRNWIGISNNANYRNLVDEWTLGEMYRVRIGHVMAAFGLGFPQATAVRTLLASLATQNRNGLPL
jgi:hypothetical protein